MMTKVFISGIEGNMGRRYTAILRKMDVEVKGADKELCYIAQAQFCDEWKPHGIIVATPTVQHPDALCQFLNLETPILCEKPIAKSPLTEDSKNRYLQMVNQYAYLVDDPNRKGSSHYSYFKSGADGLYWDCINIIGMANGPVEISNESPFWRCQINGQKLSLADMDMAYWRMIKAWITNPVSNMDYAVKAHDKVWQYMVDELKTLDDNVVPFKRPQ